jgi:hypothetical protein
LDQRRKSHERNAVAGLGSRLHARSSHSLDSLTGRCSPHTWAGLPDIIPAEARDLDWQELLRNLAGLVEPDIDPQRISIEQGCRLYRCVSIGAQLVRPDATQSWIRAA